MSKVENINDRGLAMYRTDPHFEKRMMLVKEALKKDRSVEEIHEDLRGAGIIDKNGNVRKPYDKVFYSSHK